MERIALITGGGKGIGREIALAFAREGLAVAVGGRDRDALRETAAEAGTLGSRDDISEVVINEEVVRHGAEPMMVYDRAESA